MRRADPARAYGLLNRVIVTLLSAILSGLVISPLNRSAFTPQMQVLGSEAGLPILPEVEFALYLRVQEGPQEIAAIADAIARAARRRHVT